MGTEKIEGVRLIDVSSGRDQRGRTEKLYDRNSFHRECLNTDWSQSFLSVTEGKGVIRGIHWQEEPLLETKLIRCIRGAVFDVLVDVRPESATFGQWRSYELSEDCPKSLYVPNGVAHGFQSLSKCSEMVYMISAPYDETLQRGLNWNDGRLRIPWPLQCSMVSGRDDKLPTFEMVFGDQFSH